MNSKKSKQIRKIISQGSSLTTPTKRVYRRAKREYSKVPSDKKDIFLKSLSKMFSN